MVDAPGDILGVTQFWHSASSFSMIFFGGIQSVLVGKFCWVPAKAVTDES